MAEEKRIVFSAVDNVSQQTNKIYSGIIGQAQKYSSTLKDQVTYINQQIKALEKKAQLEAKSNEQVINDLKKQSQASAPGLVRNEFNKVIREERRTRSASELESAEAISLLKELVSETKRNASVSERTEKEMVKEEQRKSKYEDLRTARGEARVNPKGVRSRFAAAEQGGYGDMSSAEIERLHYQKSFVDKNDPATFRTIVGAMVTTGAIKDIMSGMKTIISSPTGTQGLTSIVSGAGSGMMGMGIASGNPLLAAGGGVIELLSTLFGGSTEAKYALRPGFNRMNARAGGGVGIGGNTALGFTSLQAQGLQEGLMGASGSAGNISNLTSQAQTLSRGLSLSDATLIQIAKAMKMVGSANDLVTVTSQVLRANKDFLGAGGRVQLEDVMRVNLSLIQTLAGQTETVNQGSVGGFIGGLRRAGGNLFNNPEYLSQVAGNINSGLTSPSSDFQKARSFGVLSDINPGASYFQLLKMKEQGVGQQGYFSGMLKQLQRESGGGENFALSLMQNFGLQAGTAEKLTQAFSKNPSLFAGFKGPVNDQTIAQLTGMGNAKQFTPENEQVQAAASERALLGTGSNLIGQVDKLISAFTANTESSNRLTSAIESKYGTDNGVTNK